MTVPQAAAQVNKTPPQPAGRPATLRAAGNAGQPQALDAIASRVTDLIVRLNSIVGRAKETADTIGLIPAPNPPGPVLPPQGNQSKLDGINQSIDQAGFLVSMLQDQIDRFGGL